MAKKKQTKVTIDEFIKFYEEDKTDITGYPIINIRGSNGSGKSTLLKHYFYNDERAFFVTDEEGKVLATVFPKFNTIAMGKYTDKINGGCDTLKGIEMVTETLMKLWMLPYVIIFEGIIVTSSYVRYNKFLQYFKENGSPRKELVIHLLPPLEVSYARITARNGGKPFGEKSVIGKYKQTVKSAKDTPTVYGLNSIVYDNQYDSPDNFIDAMHKLIADNI